MLTLYSHPTCPYTPRVKVVLALKKIDYELVDPATLGERAAYLAIVPSGRVPALALADGRVLVESEVICEFLEDQFPEQPAFPADPFERARLRSIVRLCDIDLARPLGRVGELAASGQAGPEVLAAISSQIESALLRLAPLISGPLIRGQQPSHADAVIAVTLSTLELTMPMIGSSWSGTAAASWLPYREAVNADPALGPIVRPWREAVVGALSG